VLTLFAYWKGIYGFPHTTFQWLLLSRHLSQRKNAFGNQPDQKQNPVLFRFIKNHKKKAKADQKTNVFTLREFELNT